MQGAAHRTPQPEFSAQTRETVDRYSLASEFPLAGVQRQTKLAPPATRLTLRQRGFDSAPVDISYGTARSWFGDCLLAWTALGICWLELHPDSQSLPQLKRNWMPARLIHDATGAARRLRDISETAASSMPLHLSGTAFQLQVWSVLLRIRPGYYLSYGDVAREIGAPRAARAIGQAVGANSVAVLVPCHRVLPEGGQLGGYRWGPDLKLALLQRETGIAAGSIL